MLAYSLVGKKDPLSFTRKIYGYTDSSHNGDYKYERKGILSDLSFEKIGKGVVMIKPKDKKLVLREFKEIGLKVRVYDLEVKSIA